MYRRTPRDHPEMDFATAVRVRQYGAKKPPLTDERRCRVQVVVGIGIRDYPNPPRTRPALNLTPSEPQHEPPNP